MINTYIIIKNNTILRVYRSADKSGVIKALTNAGINSYDQIKQIDLATKFPRIDESGYYIDQIKPYNGMQYIPNAPEIIENHIPRYNGTWEQVEDIRGTYYHIETKEKIEINTYETEIDLSTYTKLVPEIYDKWNNTAWAFDYEKYRDNKIAELRAKCREERETFFPDSVKDNLLVGQTYSNPLLTVENYNKLVTFYRSIVSLFEPELMALTSKNEIDTLYNSIEWPTEEKIMELLNA